MLLNLKQNKVEWGNAKISTFKTSQTLFQVFWWIYFHYRLYATNMVLMVIIKSELGHYYLVNQENNIFLVSIQYKNKKEGL